MSAQARRVFLRGAVASLSTAWLGCGGAPPAPPRPPPEEPEVEVARLWDLLPAAGLRWLLLARPREVASIPWLATSLGRVLPEENLDRFAGATGVDLRKLPEALVASYARGGDEDGDASVLFYVARHGGDPLTIERRFRERLTVEPRRAVDAPGVVRVGGGRGEGTQALVLLGRSVVGAQSGGSIERGPARIAALYATRKLRRSPTALASPALSALAARLGPAPLLAFAPGPFEGELARGARGLLAGAVAVGLAARPSARERVRVSIAVAGAFAEQAPAASRELAAAWDDLAASALGRLLGLDKPTEPPLSTHAADAVALTVELDPALLAEGLAVATGPWVGEALR